VTEPKAKLHKSFSDIGSANIKVTNKNTYLI